MPGGHGPDTRGKPLRSWFRPRGSLRYVRAGRPAPSRPVSPDRRGRPTRTPGGFRFLLSAAWLGGLAAALALAAVMVLLGQWQWGRYQERSEINARIDAGATGPPLPLAAVLPAPAPGQEVGPAPSRDAAWRSVTATGRYDAANEILVRGRTVLGRVGFEVVTPLLLADGSAVLVDRGWVPPAPGGASMRPEVPPPPAGAVTVTGRVHPTESGGAPVARRDGRLETRRVTTARIAPQLPYPLHHAYVLLDTQAPAADPGLTPIPARPVPAWQNWGYAIQWWLLAALVLVGYVWLVRREARREARRPARTPGAAAPAGPE